MSCVPCDDMCVDTVGVCVLRLWGLIMCVILGRCEANDLLSVLGKVLEKLCRY